MLRSVDANAERFVLAVNVIQADSILRYREGDFNETVYIKGGWVYSACLSGRNNSIAQKKIWRRQ